MNFKAFDAAGTGGGTPISIEYVDKPGLGRIALVNALLFVVTLTIYRFWAKTNVRRHIWSCVHVNGEPLEYTGRGLELFLGALIVFGLFFLPVIVTLMVLQLALGPEHPLLIVVNLLLFLFFLLFWGMALYRARRYQLSRTLWRGIRGALVGSSVTYSLLYFASTLLSGMTLGWSTPAMNLNLQERMTGDMRIGTLPFRFRGRAGPLYGPYALCWVISLLALVLLAGLIGFGTYLLGDWIKTVFEGYVTEDGEPGPMLGFIVLFAFFAGFFVFGAFYAMIWAFYTAREMAIFASYTTLDLARFRLDATGTSLIALIVGNLLLVIFTLGIATPFAQQRLVRYFCDRITVDGIVDIDKIMQSREAVGRTGEGLADAFDVGGI
ncbi:MAG: YjgN family protein [Pseudomonadota bacterium]